MPLTLRLGSPNKIPKAAATKPESPRATKNGMSGTLRIKLKHAKAPAAMNPAAPRANCPA